MTTPGGAADAARRRMEKLGGVMPSPRELPDATAVLPGAVSSATIAGEGASMSLPPQPSGSGLLYLHSISDPELRFVWVCPTKRFCFAFALLQRKILLCFSSAPAFCACPTVRCIAHQHQLHLAKPCTTEVVHHRRATACLSLICVVCIQDAAD